MRTVRSLHLLVITLKLLFFREPNVASASPVVTSPVKDRVLTSTLQKNQWSTVCRRFLSRWSQQRYCRQFLIPCRCRKWSTRRRLTRVSSRVLQIAFSLTGLHGNKLQSFIWKIYFMLYQAGVKNSTGILRCRYEASTTQDVRLHVRTTSS